MPLWQHRLHLCSHGDAAVRAAVLTCMMGATCCRTAALWRCLICGDGCWSWMDVDDDDRDDAHVMIRYCIRLYLDICLFPGAGGSRGAVA